MEPPCPVLLDTCAALWLMGGQPMSAPSRTAIRAARIANVGIYVSPFTAWEIGTLVAKGRLTLALSPDAWFETLLAQPGIRLAVLTPTLLIGSTALPGTPPSDPADQIIAAAGRLFGYCIITRDRELLAYAREGHIRAQAC